VNKEVLLYFRSFNTLPRVLFADRKNASWSTKKEQLEGKGSHFEGDSHDDDLVADDAVETQNC